LVSAFNMSFLVLALLDDKSAGLPSDVTSIAAFHYPFFCNPPCVAWIALSIIKYKSQGQYG